MRIFTTPLILLFVSFNAWSACLTPNGTVGQLQYFSNVMHICDATGWHTITGLSSGVCTQNGQITDGGGTALICNNGQNQLIGTGSSDGMCSTPGMIMYRNGALEWCDGLMTWQMLAY